MTTTAQSLRTGSPRTGGAILADGLISHGIRCMTCVPGESFLGFLDAAYDRRNRLSLITCRHEAGASYMAEAMGKLSGLPGVCFVTRGPGACQAAVGLHTARQDSTPLLLLVGGVPRALAGREAFQELDMETFFSPVAKLVETITDPARIPEALARAFAAATSGRPGPAVLVLPEDVLDEAAIVADCPPITAFPASPDAGAMEELAVRLAEAERPLAIVGRVGWTAEATQAFTAFAEAWSLPVAASFRCQDLVDNRLSIYAGELGFSMSPALGERVRQADLLLVAGARLTEVDTAGWTLVSAPQPRQALIHAFPDPAELGRSCRPALGIATAMPAFAQALAALPPPQTPRWQSWQRAVRADYQANLVPGPCPGPLDLGAIMARLDSELPDDAILCLGAGNFTGWAQRFRRYRSFATQISPGNGSMGYGLPAALAAKALHPERLVVGFAGDGDFMMTGNELATARLHGLGPVIIVVDNGIYGTVRMHQERRHPGRPMATDLANPDFAALAAAHGFFAEAVERTEDFAPAFARARAAGSLALLHLHLDPEAISSRTTLSAIRGKAG